MDGREISKDFLEDYINHYNVSGIIDAKEEIVNIPTTENAIRHHGKLKYEKTPIRPQIYEIEKEEEVKNK